jgi:hypothetical protein
MTKTLLRFLVAAAAGVFGLLWSGTFAPQKPADLLTQAEARIGRPLTPLSYAGVARRTTRRAVAVGAYGAAVAAPVVVAPAPVVVAPAARTCVQAVDAYGRVFYRC